MNTNIKKRISTIFAIAIMAGIVGIAYGFMPATTKKVATHTQWYFTGTSINDIMDPAFWTTTDPENPECNEDVEALPCRYESDVPLTDSVELIGYFVDNYGGDENLVIDNSETWRPEPL